MILFKNSALYSFAYGNLIFVPGWLVNTTFNWKKHFNKIVKYLERLKIALQSHFDATWSMWPELEASTLLFENIERKIRFPLVVST
jgi:hypothetical protein